MSDIPKYANLPFGQKCADAFAEVHKGVTWCWGRISKMDDEPLEECEYSFLLL